MNFEISEEQQLIIDTANKIGEEFDGEGSEPLDGAGPQGGPQGEKEGTFVPFAQYVPPDKFRDRFAGIVCLLCKFVKP